EVCKRSRAQRKVLLHGRQPCLARIFVGTIPNINDRTTSNGADIARPGDGMDWVTTSFWCTFQAGSGPSQSFDHASRQCRSRSPYGMAHSAAAGASLGPGRLTAAAWFHHAVLAQQRAELVVAQAEQRRSLDLVVAGGGKCTPDQGDLKLGNFCLDVAGQGYRLFRLGRGDRLGLDRRAERRGKRVEDDGVDRLASRGTMNRALHHVLQFAHVARPPI